MAIDLTGGEAKVIGNAGDNHLFRLSNPEGETLIDADGLYEAEFITNSRSKSAVVIDVSQVATGVLLLPVTIKDGFYRVRRLNPRRTLLTIEVEAR